MDRYEVDLSEVEHLFAKRIPEHIVQKINVWVLEVEMNGLPNARKTPGYHDEPLKGNRTGQRSIRLNRAYRLFYVVRPGNVIVVKVIEVNKHEY